MVMHRWTPSFQIPTTSLDYNSMSDKQCGCYRIFKLLVYLLAIMIFLAFSIVYSLRKEALFKSRREHERHDQLDQQYEASFHAYIKDISNILLQMTDGAETSQKHLLDIQAKTLVILRHLDPRRKGNVILFLYERNLIQSNKLNLRGIDLSNVQITCPHDLHQLWLPQVKWSNAAFVNCRLVAVNFDQASFTNGRFINSTLQNASFAEANLDFSEFPYSIISSVNFNGATLVQADFLQADVVQGNNFADADLYLAKFTSDQLEGKKSSIVPHDFQHARFPNGSFGFIETDKNLVINGDAEMECLAVQQTKWKTIDPKTILSTEKFEDPTLSDYSLGNCSFSISHAARVYQEIHLHAYSVLIDTENGALSFLALATCPTSYFEIQMYRSDGILHSSKVYSKHRDDMNGFNDTLMSPYGEYQHPLLARTRRVQIYFGIKSSERNASCYFDNIELNIHQNRTK